MTITTRFTRKFGIEHPIALAPMVPAAGGALASAVADGGGLGLLGGGYADRDWFEAQTAKLTRRDIGIGFITWSLREVPELLDRALEAKPRAVMLSFADPAPYAPSIRAAGVPLICQVHTLEHAYRAVDVGADVVVAQGTEAGGHGLDARSTMPFVPAVVDALAKRAPDVLILAAGGIGDGRGLAASLMLGADGVLMGTRFWATEEALIPEAAKRKVLGATGDETVRTSVYDIVKQKRWPAGYTGRQMRNAFVDRWQGRHEDLATVRADELRRVLEAWDDGDFDTANVTVGEAIGLVRDLPAAAELVHRTIEEAEAALWRVGGMQGLQRSPNDRDSLPKT